jgi:hypothetical protein
MSGTLWIGNYDQDELVLLPPVSFVVYVYDEIKVCISESYPEIMEEINNAYTYEFSLNLADLSNDKFKIVSNCLISFHNRVLINPKTKIDFFQIFFSNWLYLGLILDDRNESNDYLATSTVIVGTKQQQFIRWCIKILLCDLLFDYRRTIEDPLQTDILNAIRSENLIDITTFSGELLSQIPPSDKIYTFLGASYVKKVYREFLEAFKVFLEKN